LEFLEKHPPGRSGEIVISISHLRAPLD